MKSIKMLGLVAATTLMALVFVGASSAMANDGTALCKEDPLMEEGGKHLDLCPTGKLVSHVHEETLKGEQAILLTSVLTVKCDVLFLGDVLTAGLLAKVPEPLLISGTLTYSNCNNSCTFTEENGPGHLEVAKEGHELAKVTFKDLIHMVCGAFINCRYNGTGLLAHGLGALTSSETNGSTTLSEQTTNKESGALCPSTAKLDITTTPLEPIYISS